MPTFTEPYGPKWEYATEDELLDFCNRFRQAGGGEVIDGLMPGNVAEKKSCLIANALNFHSEVNANVNAEWYVSFPGRATPANPNPVPIERIKAIAAELGLKTRGRRIYLPERIGNTAHAFDNAKRGWVTKYRLKEKK